MAKNKTTFTEESVLQFIDEVENEQKRKDSLQLMKWMEEVSGEKARMWGPTIIGFGEYFYKYESGHEGSAPLLGFSPRKSAFSLYVFTGLDEHKDLLEDLGKFTTGKACIYVKKLSDLNEKNLKELMQFTINYMSNKFVKLST